MFFKAFVCLKKLFANNGLNETTDRGCQEHCPFRLSRSDHSEERGKRIKSNYKLEVYSDGDTEVM